MTRREAAMDYFRKGYNCSQSIVLAFKDMLPIDKNKLSRMTSSFGGGMGRLREVCGSVSGMFMIAGLLYGYDEPVPEERTNEYYKKRPCPELIGDAAEILEEFIKENPVK